jgi:hypothetical protein
LQRLPDLARLAPVISEILGGEILERIAHPAFHDALRVNVHDRRQNFCHCEDRGLRRRIGLGGKRSRSQEAHHC